MAKTRTLTLKFHQVNFFKSPFLDYYFCFSPVPGEEKIYEFIEYDDYKYYHHEFYGQCDVSCLEINKQALQEAREAFWASLTPPRWPFPIPQPAKEGTRLPAIAVDMNRLFKACRSRLAMHNSIAPNLAASRLWIIPSDSLKPFEECTSGSDGADCIDRPSGHKKAFWKRLFRIKIGHLRGLPEADANLTETMAIGSGPDSIPCVGQLFWQGKAFWKWLFRIKIGRILGLPEADAHLAEAIAIIEEARSHLERLERLDLAQYDNIFMTYIHALVKKRHIAHTSIRKNNILEDIVSMEKSFIEAAEAEIEKIKCIDEYYYKCRKSFPRISTSKPSRKWLKAAESAINDHDLAACLLKELEAARDLMEKDPDGIDSYLREFIWASAFLPAAKVVPLLGDIAELAYRKTPNGIAKESIGNACVWALQSLATKEAAAQLVRVLNRVHYPKVRKTVDKALRAVADKLGISRHELEEIAAPDHGLADGKRRIELDGGAAIISLRQNRLELSWENEKGQRTKTPPTSLKKKSPESIREIKALLKQIEKDVAIQRRRLESMYLQNIEMPGENWLHQYVNHGTVGLLAQRLLWQARFPDGETVTVLPASGQCETMDGTAVDCSKAIIRLWHPLFSNDEEVKQWRHRLRELEIVQPFRQVWREVYLLTDAEHETHTYTNRWAGHIVRQHQMLNLAQQNGWRAVHRMWVDAPNDEPWRIHLPAFGLYAEFWVQGAGDRDNPPVLDNMAYKYLLTDRVRFCRLDENARWGRGEDIPLEEVPPIIFSEIMRHCDLFISVASIARDPYWMDAGPDADHPSDWDHYWRMQHEARIRESGRRRREILAAILPGLARAEAFSLRENHLHVRGRRHDYLIHLDSAGVLKLPERRHICIVPSSRMKSDSRRIALPDEGDEILSLILSKALLLADDDRIKDPVILTQLEGGR